MRELTTDLDNILDLIACSYDYGFYDDVLFDAFADMMDDKLSDVEIESFARKIESKEGYGEEDYVEIKERLSTFKKRYISNE